MTAGIPTAIHDLYANEDAHDVNGKSANSGWYDLQGRRLSGKPAKGIFIHNGRKVAK